MKKSIQELKKESTAREKCRQQIIIRFVWDELSRYSEEQGEMKQIEPVLYFYVDRILFVNAVF